jgi:GNAT superfamily N-acetyltransferase
MQLELQPSPSVDDARLVESGLRSFTDGHAGPVNARPFGVYLRASDGSTLGGLNAELRWTWLYVAHLWLPEEHRGRGIGSELLRRAEEFAREQGARAAYLDTLDFQAVDFYQRRGYMVFGTLEDFPPGFRRFYLQKALA